MKTTASINLRSLFAELSSLPHYVPHANRLADAEAAEIAEKFGECLDDVRSDLAQANEFASCPSGRADLLGQFPNARRLLFGYLYDAHYEAHCDSESASRHDFQD